MMKISEYLKWYLENHGGTTHELVLDMYRFGNSDIAFTDADKRCAKEIVACIADDVRVKSLTAALRKAAFAFAPKKDGEEVATDDDLWDTESSQGRFFWNCANYVKALHQAKLLSGEEFARQYVSYWKIMSNLLAAWI